MLTQTANLTDGHIWIKSKISIINKGQNILLAPPSSQYTPSHPTSAKPLNIVSASTLHDNLIIWILWNRKLNVWIDGFWSWKLWNFILFKLSAKLSFSCSLFRLSSVSL